MIPTTRRTLIVHPTEGPYRTINAALAEAQPGDEVIVAPGIYRETVTPVTSGTPEAPIRISAAVPHAAIVRGSDLLAGEWAPGLHTIPLDIVGRNPFAEPLAGSRIGGTCGQVFHGGRPLREVGNPGFVADRPDTWAAIEGGAALMVHIGTTAPAGIEISVRDRLFAPRDRGMGHFVIEGFIFEHCANQSAAAFWESTRRQCGAVGFRAGHHIVFRQNIVRHAKTIGIDLGIEGGLDVTTEHIPHDNLVEKNLICDNGEVGACGRETRRTVIRNNQVERNGHLSLHTVEEAGLKFHQFREGLIEGNLVRSNECAGIWLDALWTDARVTRNLVIDNVGCGIFMELGDRATVDHNVVAYTRLGDGIYSHDASDVLYAHNLVFGNTHFGMYCRYVTDRPYEWADGAHRPAECSRNQLLNNLFVDNYRGHICLPADGPRSGGNVSNGNHFINGTQWQWEGLGFHRFCLGDNDGDLTAEAVRDQAGVDAERWAANAYLSLAEWRALGFDSDSHAPEAFRITKENGAVVKGTATLGAQDAFLQFRLSTDAVSPLRPTPANLDCDYHGHPRPALSAPGPFVTLTEGNHIIDLMPL